MVDLDDRIPSMRNPLDKSSIAQSLDGHRLTGSLRFPDGRKFKSALYAVQAAYNERHCRTPMRCRYLYFFRQWFMQIV
jgi:hypothetical protein